MKRACFLGLGVMGFPMAGHLADKAGLAVTVYNRTPAKAGEWLKCHSGRSAATPAEAARDSDFIFICVGNDNDLEHVLTGPEGVIHSVKPEAVIADHTTVSAAVSRRMSEIFKQKKVAFLDAPVSGGQVGAEKGALTVMVGGDKTAFDRLEAPLRLAYAREIRHMGSSGAGQLTKMVNQICIAATIEALAEGLAFGQKAGLNMTDVLAVISKGAAQSWQMDNRGHTMIEGKFDFGFALDWMVKDLGIAIEESAHNGARLPITTQVREFYKELSAAGHGRLDTSALIKRLK